MDITGEIGALRSEQRRLHGALGRLDDRITSLEQWSAVRPEPAPPLVALAPVPPLPVAPPPVKPAPFPPEDQAAPKPQPAPEPLAPARAAEPRGPQRRVARPESLEVEFGRVWLVRIGIVILLTGLVFLGNYAYHEFIGRLGAAGKLALILLAGGGLAGLGRWLARRRLALRTYGRVLVAGGCATLYYAAFAAHFVPSLRVIASPFVGGGLLLAVGAAFAFWADRRKSQTLASATIALSFYTAAINAVGAFSLFSNLVISAVALALLVRHRWTGLSFLSLAGSYGAFAFWRFQQTSSLLPTANPEIFWPAVLFPAAYWLVHTAATFVRSPRGLDPESRPIFLTVNNGALYALVGTAVWANHPSTFWIFTLGFGLALIALAALAARHSPGEHTFDGTHLAQGLGLVVLGVFVKFSGWRLGLSLALMAATLVTLGRHRHGTVMRFFAGVCAVIATTTAAGDCLEGTEHARLTAAGIAAVLAGMVITLKRQTGDLRTDWRALGFGALAMLLVALAAWQENLFTAALTTLGVALAAVALFRVRPIREFAFLVQPLALVGQAELALHASVNLPAATIASAVAGLAFIGCWQHLLRALPGRLAWQHLQAAVPVALGLVWILDRLPLEHCGPALAGVALLLLAAGLRLRTGVLATSSIPFTLAALGAVTVAIGERTPVAPAALTAALLLLQSPVLGRSALPANWLGVLRPTLRGIALLLGVTLAFAHVDAGAWFNVFALAGLGFFAASVWNRSLETLGHGLFLVVLAAGTWFVRLPVAAPVATDGAGFLALALAGQILRRHPAPDVTRAVPPALAGLAVLGGWLLLHRLVGENADGFLLTVSWSLLALVAITAGFALRDRTYRLLGLTVLGATLIRIFLVDVWQLDTLLRILSFLVLGAVLLALGFLYNRYADRIRRWL